MNSPYLYQHRLSLLCVAYVEVAYRFWKWSVVQGADSESFDPYHPYNNIDPWTTWPLSRYTEFFVNTQFKYIFTTNQGSNTPEMKYNNYEILISDYTVTYSILRNNHIQFLDFVWQ